MGSNADRVISIHFPKERLQKILKRNLIPTVKVGFTSIIYFGINYFDYYNC